ncbi:unnamed protein product [Urochloa humidicola]
MFAVLSSRDNIYILRILFTEATTPFINIWWYLDRAGRKGSKLYLYNGPALFFGWLDHGYRRICNRNLALPNPSKCL